MPITVNVSSPVEGTPRMAGERCFTEDGFSKKESGDFSIKTTFAYSGSGAHRETEKLKNPPSLTLFKDVHFIIGRHKQADVDCFEIDK